MFQQFKEIFLDIRIVYKFLLVFVTMLIGLGVITYAFQLTLEQHRIAITDIKAQTEALTHIETIQVELLTAIQNEQDYRLLSQAEMLESFKTHLKLTNTYLNHLPVTGESKAELAMIKKTLSDYEHAVINSTEAKSTPANLKNLTNTLLAELKQLKTHQTHNHSQRFGELESLYAQSQHLFYGIITLVALVTISLLWLVVIAGVVNPISYLQSTVNEIAAGNLEARVDGVGHDEIGKLAQAFDALLDERATSFARTEYDHHQLNTSIITLLRSVSILSQKDLTVSIPVAEDMTGAVSDAINLLTSEIAATLKEVRLISAKVNTASDQVKQQSGHVRVYADNQRKEIDATLEELNTVVNTMIKIAKFSQVTDKESEKTMLTTESAVEAVTQTISSINSIRDIIREAEKRIKRLGERSQEITSVVNIINNIAERTHVLSLNAGMQAAAAGEAGKGFMVIANEVQRLAESSREATEKIATLVKNIQIDTSDTMKTMNTVISQVVDGTQQAEEAGKRMKESRTTTESLVSSVKKIATTTIGQLAVGRSLKEHAQNIQNSTIKTNEQLQQQRQLSDDLAHYAAELIVKVAIFKLPE
jgi:methyl-accepting chemotaxis protein